MVSFSLSSPQWFKLTKNIAFSLSKFSYFVMIGLVESYLCKHLLTASRVSLEARTLIF